jgi:putative redox protein
VDTSRTQAEKNAAKPPDVVVSGDARDFRQQIVTGKHQLIADEPESIPGGTDTGPGPYDYLLGALGSCTAMTIGWHARKRKIPLKSIKVSLRHSRIHAKDCEDCLTKDGMLDRIDLEIELDGDLTPDQRRILMEAARRCPVHRTLTSEIEIRTHEAKVTSPPPS